MGGKVSNGGRLLSKDFCIGDLGGGGGGGFLGGGFLGGGVFLEGLIFRGDYIPHFTVLVKRR